MVGEDRRRVSEISSQIWDGHDWVPDALDEWLDDGAGEAVVAELDGIVIGYARRTWILPGQAWFEGIRIDPAHRGAGAGRAITKHLIEGARRDGAKRIHLSTHTDNQASIHIVESYGFLRVASFAHLERDVAKDVPDGRADREIVPVPGAEAIRFIDRSEFLELAKRRFPRGWRFIPFDLDPQEATARLGTRIGVQRGGALVALLCLREPPGASRPTVLNFGDGSPDDLRKLLRYAHQLHAGQRIEVMVPVHDGPAARLLEILRESNYTAWDDEGPTVFAYELVLA